MTKFNQQTLQTICNTVYTDTDNLLKYGRDWSRLHEAKAQAVVFPESIEQVQALVQYANQHHIALVPSGGRTGMSGAALAHNNEIVVSFERMSQILHFDAADASVICQPGVVTQTLQEFAQQQSLFYPVDFGSRGSSQIGGNIATNAGGIKVIRYGLTRNWVTGLKVVTGKGDLLNLNNGLIKNATGYDLRHLFIGSEGTLGFIVEATIKLTKKPQEPRVMVLGVPQRDAMMKIFTAAQRQLNLNAFEFFTGLCLKHVIDKGLQAPFESLCPYYVLIEFDNISQASMDDALAFYEECAAAGWLEDGVISESENQARELWRLREDITESIAEFTPYKNDIAVPVGKVAAFLQHIEPLLQQQYPDFEVLWFGHVGDGNLHINVLKPAPLDQAGFVDRCQHVNELLFKTIQHFGGSISAEHGVGLTKKPYLGFTRDAVEIAYLRGIKQVFDPNGIMNPGKIFD